MEYLQHDYSNNILFKYLFSVKSEKFQAKQSGKSDKIWSNYFASKQKVSTYKNLFKVLLYSDNPEMSSTENVKHGI